MWADATDADFVSSAANQFNVRATGGVKIYTSGDMESGVAVNPGSGTWTSISDSNAKKNIRIVKTDEILEKVSSLSIKQWSYKTQNDSIEHIGPMAQDFYSTFHIGDDDKTISVIDPAGVSLAAIQELHKQNKKLIQQNEQLNNRLTQLEQQMKLILEGTK